MTTRAITHATYEPDFEDRPSLSLMTIGEITAPNDDASKVTGSRLFVLNIFLWAAVLVLIVTTQS